ncbi:hypothetical protein HU200_054129 [Digitaria exilis]|uniref:DUF4220 domain-containing protein n=1 Tax=Digitaria exilis TaxID=1010633 RepID=A0A835AJ64_9POAL|nr:hypothetical protein HU200_054129 [Digitaria exilis]
MGFSEAVQWWEEWQVRVLVLGSLFLQYFLYFAAPLRSDALAIYALAALFNRHKKTLSKNASLEALWAPILLVHLGGHDDLRTALSVSFDRLYTKEQYSLIGYLASKRKHKTLTSITAFLGCEDYLDPLWCMKPFNWAMFITWLVTRFVETWKRDHGSEGGRAFNDNRGHWTLKRHGCGGSNILRESLRRPFDESVLVWHLATEFCFDRMGNIPDNDDDALYHLATCYFAHLDALWSKNENKNTGSNDDAGDDNTGGNDDDEDNNTGGNDAGSNNTGDDNTGGNDAGNNNTGDDNNGGNNADVDNTDDDNTDGNSTGDDDNIDNDTLANVRISSVISNYMVYLLFVNPEMLMTGARPSLFRNAYKRLNGMLDDGEERAAALTEKDLAQKIIQELKGGAKGRGVIDDAWALSQELTKLCNDDNDKMWKVIFGVWVEMLCFSASRCRGYLHAKSLGKGGEYLSYIWLLLSRMGMETLSDKMQRAQDPPEQQDDDASGAGAEFTDTTSTTPARTIISDKNEKAGPQEEKASHDGATCTTPAATVIGDEKRDEASHCATSAAPAIPVIGDENV